MAGLNQFTGRLGFILASAAAAIGLGNIWRFPYLVAEYGGGVFVQIYFLFVLSLGFALITAEIAIGRKSGKVRWKHLSAFAVIARYSQK